MDNKEKDTELQISLSDCAVAITKRWYIVAVATLLGILVAVFGFILPHEREYSATVKMYVNNKESGSAGGSWSQSDIVTSRALVKEYLVVLRSRPTLDSTCEYLKEQYGYDLDYTDLLKKIDGDSIDETTVFYINVTDTDPAKAVNIVNAIASNFPDEVEKIFDGSRVSVIENAIDPTPVPEGKLSKLVIGAFLGFALSAIYSIVMGVFINDTIEASDWLTSSFGDIPVLGEIPDFTVSDTSNKYSYRSHVQNADKTRKQEGEGK